MIEVISPSALTTIQDSGRTGWLAFGVPRGGAMDWYAHRAANLLVGNAPDDAAIEIGFSSAEFLAREDCLIAVSGAGFNLIVHDRPMRLWTSIYVRKNWTIKLDKIDSGNWAYLALHGSITTAPTLGARSTNPRIRLGDLRPLQTGDVIPIGSSTRSLIDLASRSMHPLTINYSSSTIHVIQGVQANQFPPESLSTFYSSTYIISPTSDRMGYRLIGDAIKRADNTELISEGMSRGCIQIPNDGLPIVMQADCPTTGGYPKIASVISADQPILAQAPIGKGQIHFVETTIDEAQKKYRALMSEIKINSFCETYVG
jgi:antagonist of KipI